MTDAKPSEPGLFDGYWTEDDLADQRGVTTRTLRGERQAGQGPPYVKIGRRVHYPIAETREWLAQRMVSPSREQAPAPQADRSPTLKSRVTPAAKPQPPAPRAASQGPPPRASGRMLAELER